MVGRPRGKGRGIVPLEILEVAGRMMKATTHHELMAEALKKVELAISEIKVIKRYKEKVVIGEKVVNHDAVVRARKAYLEAARAVGTVRQLAGLTQGEQRPSGRVVAGAVAKLEEYRVELERLQGLS